MTGLGKYRSDALAIVRIYLGIGLAIRGAMFVGQPEILLGLIDSTGDWFLPYAIAHAVALAHLGGGVLLAAGLLTRVAAAVQMPPVIAAIMLIHLGDGLFVSGQALELSLLVLVLLSIFVVFGAGRFSVDHRLEAGVTPSQAFSATA